jgi:hypothetical protein
VAGHETFVVASGAACVLLQVKARSMTHWRGSPCRLRAPAYSGHAGAGFVVVKHSPDTTFIKDSPGATRAGRVSAELSSFRQLIPATRRTFFERRYL